MTKAIVLPVGDHAYLDPTNGKFIRERVPSVVSYTSFVSSKVGDGKIKLILANLPESADNEVFLEHLKDSDLDVDLAVASFASLFGLDKVGSPLPKEVAEAALDNTGTMLDVVDESVSSEDQADEDQDKEEDSENKGRRGRRPRN